MQRGARPRGSNALSEVERDLALRTVYAGHGAPGDAALFAAQRDYLEFFRAVVAGAAIDGRAAADVVSDVRSATLARYPGWPLEFLIPLNAEGVRAELAATAH